MPAARLTPLQEFLNQETLGGAILVLAAVAALGLANSSAAPLYENILHLPIVVSAGGVGLHKSLLHWINDGAMAVFFLLVGLEIKRETLTGELATVRKAALPGLAAMGGMAVPAAIYAALNWGDAEALRGWAIPAATDIAFALGALALVSRHAPPQLRAFLLALAILDDLGAVLIIAVFYTPGLSVTALVLAAGCLLVLAGLNRARVQAIAPYVVVGIALWLCVLESGVHATLAGVALAFAIPLRLDPSPLLRVEHALHPYVTWGILPLFSFANAGVDLRAFSPAILVDNETLGIALGLLFGKQIGVVAATAIGVWSRAGALPAGVGWRQFHGMAVLCGIGFTMSLFIGGLAFTDPLRDAETRVGILAGSVISACVGMALLRFAPRTPSADSVARQK